MASTTAAGDNIDDLRAGDFNSMVDVAMNSEFGTLLSVATARRLRLLYDILRVGNLRRFPT